MATTWILHRFRSAFLQENLLLIVLGLLKDREMSEWEVLSATYSRYRSTPSAKQFRRLVDSLVGGGFASFVLEEKGRKLRITESGLQLLKGLDDEYRDILYCIEDAMENRSSVSTA